MCESMVCLGDTLSSGLAVGEQPRETWYEGTILRKQRLAQDDFSWQQPFLRKKLLLTVDTSQVSSLLTV